MTIFACFRYFLITEIQLVSFLFIALNIFRNSTTRFVLRPAIPRLKKRAYQ